MHKQIREQVAHYIAKAEQIFGREFKSIPIKFDLKGKCGGQFCYRRGPRGGGKKWFRFNIYLAHNNQEDYLNQTVPHEVAHYIQWELYGHDVDPHGREWKSIMIRFGVKPKRCHNYATKDSKAPKYPYRCQCRTHQLTKQQHGLAKKGRVFACKKCKFQLRFKQPNSEGEQLT